MGKPLENYNHALSHYPALNAFAVTPSDSVDLAHVARGVYVAVEGTLTVTTYNGDTVTFTALAAGILHNITATRIWSTGTAATGIVAVY
jgi:hypothetical protein